mmetsp:Transcript_43289/g.71526  ORF Transcript_43289/g.71526 Transcript_43289/m.71526 type:complete len:340 (-) Transcript_43289:97-1116(-)
MADNYNPNQQQQYINNQGGGGNWNQPPQQQQYPQYGNQQQYGNANPQYQQQQQPPPQQYNNNQGNEQWNPPQNQPQYVGQQGGWNAPPNQEQPLKGGYGPGPHGHPNGRPDHEQTWSSGPKVTVHKDGNKTVTETEESGGGREYSSGFQPVEFTGPKQLGPGHVTESGPYQPQTDEEQIDYFRLKLWESGCLCGCCGNVSQNPCLNLWIWSIFWLIVFMVNTFINIIVSLAQLGNSSAWSVIAILIMLVSLGVNAWAMYALFKLKPRAFLVQCIFFILLLLLVIISLFVYGFNFGYFLIVAIFGTCAVWALLVFYRVYGWAKHFKNGGAYDPDTMSPPK